MAPFTRSRTRSPRKSRWRFAIEGTPLTVTMRTPGNDLELAAGFLLTEGIIESRDQLAKIRAAAPDSGAKSNVVEVQLENTQFTPENLQRNFFAASSCGICGKASIEAIRRRGLRPPDCDFRVRPEVLCRLPEIAARGSAGLRSYRRPARCRAL